MQDETAHEARRGRQDAHKGSLLEAAADYVLAHGLAGLSIRPLAAAMGLSHRTVLYHFGSKEQLVLRVLDVIRDRDRDRIARHLAGVGATSAVELFRAAWRYFSAPDRLPYMRLLHEVLTLGLSAQPYRTWSLAVIDSRTGMIAGALARLGVPAERTRAAATLVTAAVRGLQLHLMTTDDRTVVDAAFEELLSGLDHRLRS